MNAAISTLTTKGQVTIPKSVRDSLHLLSGDKVEFFLNDQDEIVIKPITKKAAEVAGMLSKYKQPAPVSIDEMNQKIKQRIKDRFS